MGGADRACVVRLLGLLGLLGLLPRCALALGAAEQALGGSMPKYAEVWLNAVWAPWGPRSELFSCLVLLFV